MLRLAFIGARSLAARSTGENISGRALREAGPRRAPEKFERRKSETGSRLSARRRSRQFRAALRNGVVAPARGRARRVGRSAGARNVGESCAARRRRPRPLENMATETL